MRPLIASETAALGHAGDALHYTCILRVKLPLHLPPLR